MQRRVIALALMAAIGAGSGCKDKTKAAPKPAPGSAAGSGDQAGSTIAGPGRIKSPGGGIAPATEPDLGYEARRAELLRRGDPAMMKDAPIMVTTAPDIKPEQMIKKISKDEIQVGNIKVNLTTGRAEIPATVASPGQPLEYIAVGKNGKAYESLLQIDVTAIELRLALSLMGYEGTLPLDEQGRVPPASEFDTVHLTAIVAGKERPISAYLIDRRIKKPAKDHGWQVIGFRPENRDQALLTKDFFTLVERDYFAPVRTTSDAGNPYAGPDHGYSGNIKLLPKEGGALTLVIKRPGNKPAPLTMPSPLNPDAPMPMPPTP